MQGSLVKDGAKDRRSIVYESRHMFLNQERGL